jgi:hypothetical protein
MSSLSWPAVVGTAINITVNTLGGMGTGAFTVVVLTKPGGNHGHIGAKVASAFDIQQLNDSNIWFGGADFSGFGTANNADWHVIGHSKASGTNVYRWHYWNYSAGGAKTHSNGSGTHANPGTITAITIGDCDNRGNGLIAAIAIWKRVLSDAEFDSLCTTNLADWKNVSGGAPDAIWALNVAAASVVDGSGNGNSASSVTGTISLTGADPPSFNYSLGGSPVTATDAPSGLRQGSAAESVTIAVTASDTPTLGQRMRSGGETVTIAVTAADTAGGLRARSPNQETVTLGTAATDSPSGLRIGTGTGESVTTVVTAADAPGGLRERSAEGPGVTVAVTTADAPTGARLGMPTAGVTVAVVVADTPRGLRALSGASSVMIGGTANVSAVDSPSGLRLGSGISVARVLQPVILEPILAPVRRASVSASVGGVIIIAPVKEHLA